MKKFFIETVNKDIVNCDTIMHDIF